MTLAEAREKAGQLRKATKPEEFVEARLFSKADAAAAFPVTKQRAVFEACLSDIQQAA